MKKGVNIVITDNRNRVLILKRSSRSKVSPNLWNLPGGNVKTEESLEQAAKREAKEETNLEIELLDDYSYVFYYSHGKKENTKTAVYAFRAESISGEVILDEDHTEFRWVSKDDWKGLDYTPSAAATLSELFK
ncbi:NUDIX hydrolase [Patescibacteria group bacterium]|nr:NUDIX hydrolase [Patescibacteria group bacterium]